jgi:polar amino acid transport system substrate-binding protein
LKVTIIIHSIKGETMKVFRSFLLITLAGLIITGPAFSAEQLKITVFTDATWPPMEMVDKNKNIVGFEIDLFNEIAKEAGFKAEFKNTAWDGIFAAMKGNRYPNACALSSITITEERKKSYDFSDPYITVNQVLIVPKTLKVQSMNDMKGKKIGAQISTTGAMEIKKFQDVITKTYDEIGLAFADMSAGRIDGVVCDTPVARDYALHKSEYRDKFKVGLEIPTKEQLGIMTKKGDKKVLDLINKGLRAVKAKGIDKQFEKKWL